MRLQKRTILKILKKPRKKSLEEKDNKKRNITFEEHTTRKRKIKR